MTDVEIIPTLVPESLHEIVELREKFRSFMTALHVDAADGKFAPNVTWMPSAGEILPDREQIHYKAHLMVADPLPVGLQFIEAGARTLEGHVEAFQSVENGLSILQAWKDEGAEQVAVALLLQTPFEDADPYFSVCDYVRLMTIPRIGTQGIPFDESSIQRVADFHERYPDMPIAVDGGVSEKNIEALRKAGVSSFTAGSAIAKADDPKAMYEHLLSLASGV